MKTKFGSIIVSGEGKLGGHVSQRNKSGTVLRSFTGVKRTGSNAQKLHRSAYRSVCSAWRSLDDVQLSSWQAVSTNYNSAFNLFVERNMQLSYLGLPLVPVYVVASDDHLLLDFSVFCSVYNNSIVARLAYPFSSDYIVVVSGSRPLSRSISFNANELVVVKSVTGISSNLVDFSNEYIQRFGRTGLLSSVIYCQISLVSKVSGVAFISAVKRIIPTATNRLLLVSSNPVATFAQTFDLAASFQNVNTIAGVSNINKLVVAADGSILAGGNSFGRIYRSVDNGASWSLVYTIAGSTNCQVHRKLYNNTLLASAGSTGKLLISTDNGLSWQVVYTSGTTFTSLYSDEDGFGTVICNFNKTVGNQGGVISRDFGKSWQPLNLSLVSHTSNGVVYLSNGRWLLGTSVIANTYLSIDNGASWSLLQTFAGVNAITNFTLLGNNMILMGGIGISNIYLSVDNGVSFLPVQTIDTNATTVAFAYDGAGTVVCLTSLQTGRVKIYRSVDNGVSWSLVYTSIAEIFASKCYYLGSGRFIAVTRAHNKVFVSTNNGASWSEWVGFGTAIQGFDLIEY